MTISDQQNNVSVVLISEPELWPKIAFYMCLPSRSKSQIKDYNFVVLEIQINKE